MVREIPEEFPGLVVVLKPDGVIVDVNDFSCTILGISRDELIGRNLREFFKQEEYELITDVTKANFGVWDFLNEGKEQVFFGFSIPDDGDENEIFLMGLKLAQDMNADLREYFKNSKLFVENIYHANIGFLAVDSEGKCIYANDVIFRFMDRKRGEIIGKRLGKVLKDYTPLVLEAIVRKQILKEIRDYELNEVRMYFDITSIPIIIKGQILGGISLFIDVTENVNLERRLIDSERMSLVGEMAARIMHDVRNPLQIVRSSVQMMSIWNEKGPIEKERLRPILNSIDMAVNSVIELMNDMLQFSKPMTDKMEMVNLKEIIEPMAGMLTPSFSKAGINFVLDVSDECEILGSRKLIRQAVLNIIQNAIEVLQDYVGERKLVIRCCEGMEKVFLEFYNTGPLIEEKIIDKIFDAFFSTKGSKGTGLGLSIAKEIVEKAHRGRISCVSSFENKGTSFIIEFPKVVEVIQKTSQLG